MTGRTVPEWIGATPDSAIPPRVRVRVFERFKGKCQCGCGRKILTGEAWHCDHITALCNSGEHRESNLRPLLVTHHALKTGDDVAEKSRIYAKKSRHLGIRKPRTICGWRLFDGSVRRVARER